MCRELAKDFVVAGTASESLYGACESMFRPDMVCHDIELYLIICDTCYFLEILFIVWDNVLYVQHNKINNWNTSPHKSSLYEHNLLDHRYA